MSILIKGMKIPFMKDNTGMKMEICKIGGIIEIGIKDGLPHASEQWHYYDVVEVPEPHGRLIDADELCKGLMSRWDTADEQGQKIISYIMASIVTPIVVGTPTVIEAEDQKHE